MKKVINIQAEVEAPESMLKRMNSFIKWWENKVKGQRLSDEQFINIMNKMV